MADADAIDVQGLWNDDVIGLAVGNSAALGKPRDAVTSLAPRDMALGQIVPFEVEIGVNGSTSPENGKIQIVGRWNTKTTSASD